MFDENKVPQSCGYSSQINCVHPVKISETPLKFSSLIMTNFSNWITRACTNHLWFMNVFSFFSCFGCYFCCYSFRKPILAATFTGKKLWGLEYKVVLLTFEIVGYTTSKFYGIKFIPEVNPRKRGFWIVTLAAIAEIFLIIFSFVGFPFAFIPLLFNGLSLGQMWGLTFSFLEGRKFSEVMAAGMGVSTIVSSGCLKSISRAILNTGKISDFWMPPFVGACFYPLLLFFVFCLESLPDPSENDIDVKTERVQMDGDDRIRYIKEFWPAVITLTALYVFIASYRDLRDNFSVELYASLKVDEGAYIFTISEVIVGFSICVPIIIFTFMKINIWYLVAYFCLMWIGELTLLLWTFLIDTGRMKGLYYMVLTGVSTYIAEMPFNGILGDLILALFKYKANSSLFMYITDSFGYASSIVILLVKNLASPNLSWGDFFIKCSYVMAFVVISFSIVSLVYLVVKLKRWTFVEADPNYLIPSAEKILDENVTFYNAPKKGENSRQLLGPILDDENE